MSNIQPEDPAPYMNHVGDQMQEAHNGLEDDFHGDAWDSDVDEFDYSVSILIPIEWNVIEPNIGSWVFFFFAIAYSYAVWGYRITK